MQARSLIKELKLDKLVEIGLLNCSVNKVGNLNTCLGSSLTKE